MTVQSLLQMMSFATKIVHKQYTLLEKVTLNIGVLGHIKMINLLNYCI